MMQLIKKAGGYIFLSYIVSQGTRLAGNLITARLLAPDLFGIMAVVMVMQQGIIMLSSIGLDAYVIRHKKYKEPTLLNIVWTIQVVRGVLLALIIVILALTLWFLQTTERINQWGVLNNNQLPLLFLFVSITPLILGFKSLAIVVRTREMNRLKLEVIEGLSQISGTLIMILWAFYFPSIWALAVAGPISISISVILSYLMFDIRHQFYFDKKVFIEIFNFGKWIFIANALTYLTLQGDRLFLSVNISETELGLYSIALALAGFATVFVQRLSAQLWLPAFSSKTSDIKTLKKNYYRVRWVQDLSVGFFVLSVTFFATTVIDILYDNRYSDVAWMLQLLVVSVFVMSISQAAKALLVAMGETKIQMQCMFLNLISLIILIPLLYSWLQLKGVIIATVISSFIAIFPQYRMMSKLSVFDFRKEMRVMPVTFIIYFIFIYFGF